MSKTSSAKATRSRPSESTDRLIVPAMKSLLSPIITLETNKRVTFPHKLKENLIINSPLTWFRLQAEADFFSSVSLNDFTTICTLGMGGFSRVELVSGRTRGRSTWPTRRSLQPRLCFLLLLSLLLLLLLMGSGAAEERDQSIVRPQSAEEAPHRGHQSAGPHPVRAPDHDGGPQPVHRQVRPSSKGGQTVLNGFNKSKFSFFKKCFYQGKWDHRW